MRAFAVAAVLVAGCIPGQPEPVYSVRRSALVPHPQPPMRTGHAADGQVRFSLFDSTVLVPVEPVETAGANAGLYVARHNVGGGLGFRIGSATELGVFGQGSLLRGAMPVTREPAPPPQDALAFALGLAFAHAIELDARFRLGLAVRLARAFIPFFEEGRCVLNCAGDGHYTETGEHGLVIGSASVLPSYRVGEATVFAGVTWINHPTNTRSDTVTASEIDDAEEVRAGPAYVLIGGGVEYAASRTVKLLAQLYQPLSTTVVTYGPAIGVGISFDFHFADARRSPP